MTKITIIEDDQVINQMYRMKFEAAGFEVYTASDGEAGSARTISSLARTAAAVELRVRRPVIITPEALVYALRKSIVR